MNETEKNLYLSNWSDLGMGSDDQYIDYDALVQSDDEWLSLESLMQVEEF